MTNPQSTLEFYKKSSVSGVKWIGFTEIVSRILQFLVTIIMARILLPNEYALITLALIIIKFVQLILDFGITSALIQLPEVSRDHYRSSFSVLLFLSGLILIVIVINPLFFSRIIGAVQLSELLRYLTIVIPLNALSVIPRVILMRNLEFKKISLAETVSTFFFAVLVGLFAIILRNIWCFIIGAIGQQVVLVVYLWWSSKWKPQLGFRWSDFKQLFRFSTSVFFTRLSNFLNINLLNVLINKFYGAAILGFFSLAYQIIDLPTQRIAKNIMKVMYPVLSQLQDRSDEYRDILLNYFLIIILITLPFFALIFLFAEPFIRFFYGEKWLNAVEFLRILCIVGFLRSLWTTISVVSMSIGRPQFELFLNLGYGFLLIPGLFLLQSQDVMIVIVYFTGTLCLFFSYGTFKIFKWMGVSISSLFRKIRTPLISGAMVISISLWVQTIDLLHFSNQTYFFYLIMAFLSGLSYLFFVYLMDHKMLTKVIRLIFPN